MKSMGLKYVSVVKGFLLDLPVPLNLGYLYGLGFLAVVVYLVQVMSGLVLSLFYSVGDDGGYWSVVGVMQDVSGGWVVRFIHSSGVSLFFVVVFVHVLRGLMYGGFKKVVVWWSGLCLMLMLMLVSLLGYVLPWGSMSYWGMTVVISMLGSVPYVGDFVVEWLWGGKSASVVTLVRFFSLHYLLGLMLLVLVVVHMVELHEEGSSNPMGVESFVDKVVFHELYVYKDVSCVLLLVVGYWYFVLGNPYVLLSGLNFEEVDYSSTPTHIKPEWYFLFAYCILRSVASKLGGVFLMLMSVVGLGLLSLGSGGLGRSVGSWYWKVSVVVFVTSFVGLTVLGGCVVESPYGLVGGGLTVVYFVAMVWLLLLGSLCGSCVGWRCV